MDLHIGQFFGLLEKILEASRKFENPHLMVMGHTDASGSDELNMKLSQKRAEAVAEFLVKIGKFTRKLAKEAEAEIRKELGLPDIEILRPNEGE